MVAPIDAFWSIAHTAYGRVAEVLPHPYRRFSERLASLARYRSKHLPYDDRTAEFHGGEMEEITSRNYEKALRNLWKAETIAPELGIHDASREEIRAAREETDEELRDIEELEGYMSSEEFERTLEEAYSPEERVALARLLSVVLHGEAYALFTSASLLPEVEGTGPRMGMAMQVVEEAKHFIVMRELVRRLDRVHPQSFWDRVALERVLAAPPADRLFGMNVVVESIALTFFGTFASYPGVGKILRYFHRDEARHTAFPKSYTDASPLSFLVRHSPIRQNRRFLMIFPLALLMFELEDDAELLGFDIFEFGGRCLDKVFRMAAKTGYYTLVNRSDAFRIYNLLVNASRRVVEGEGYSGFTDFRKARTIKLDEELAEAESLLFGSDEPEADRGLAGRLLEPLKVRLDEMGRWALDPAEATG